MSPHTTLGTAARIARQLAHDRRTVAMLMIAPAALLALVYFMFESQPGTFDRIGLMMLGIFPFLTMFLITSIAMLRERTSGTLERLLTLPLSKLDLLFGYAVAFGIAAAAQAVIAAGVAYGVLHLDTAGSAWLVLVIAVTNAALGVALGLLCSAFARTEFQAVQFLPVVVLPQVLLCGLFVPRDEMADWLQTVSALMPLTYAVDALSEVGASADPTGVMWLDLAIVTVAALLSLVAAAGTLRRRTA